MTLGALSIVGERQDSTTLSPPIKPTQGFAFHSLPARPALPLGKTKTYRNPHQPFLSFRPPQLTNTGGFSLFYCKNTTGNSIFKTEMIYMVMSTV